MSLDTSLVAETKKPFGSYILKGNSPVHLETQAKLFAAKVLLGVDEYREHPDIRIVDSENLYTVGVEDVREVIETESTVPISGNYKIFIFTPYKNLTEEASNALLKSLEDSSSSTIYILLQASQFWVHQLDDSTGGIPQTVESRCRTIFLSSSRKNSFDASLRDYILYFDFDIQEKKFKGLYSLTKEMINPPSNIYEAAYFAFMLKKTADLFSEDLKEDNILAMPKSILIQTLEYLAFVLINNETGTKKNSFRYSENILKAIEEINQGMRARIVLTKMLINSMQDDK